MCLLLGILLLLLILLNLKDFKENLQFHVTPDSVMVYVILNINTGNSRLSGGGLTVAIPPPPLTMMSYKEFVHPCELTLVCHYL
jgi:hypothetical protein